MTKMISWRNVQLGVGATAAALCMAAGGVQAQDGERLEPFWVEIPPDPAVLESADVPRTEEGLPDIFSEWTANWRTIAPNGQDVRFLSAEEGHRIVPSDFASEEEYLAWVNRDESTHPANRCIPHGGPRIMSTPYKLEIVRSGDSARLDKIILLNEQWHIIRRVYMDDNAEERVLPNEDVRGIWGTSYGDWVDRSGDGQVDTLRVETVGINGPSWLEQTGLVYSDEATFTEEYWLSEDGNILHMLYTLNDPVTYSNPIEHHIWWDRATTDAEATHDEYVCFVESARPELLLERYQNQAAVAE